MTYWHTDTTRFDDRLAPVLQRYLAAANQAAHSAEWARKHLAKGEIECAVKCQQASDEYYTLARLAAARWRNVRILGDDLATA